MSSQILLDIVRFGTKTKSAYGPAARKSNEPRPELKDQVNLVFCNPDLIWRGAFTEPRLGQGGFIKAFTTLHSVLRPFPASGYRPDKRIGT